MFTRNRYQEGSLNLKHRSNGDRVWEFRWYELGASGSQRKTITVGTQRTYATATAARKSHAVQSILHRINSGNPRVETVPTMGAVVSRYKQEELPERYATEKQYQSLLKNHVVPGWGDAPIDEIKPIPVESG